MSTNPAPASTLLVPPHGLHEITTTFGDIFSYLHSDHTLCPRWQTEHLTTVPIPFPIALSWDRSRHVEHITCHRLLQSAVEGAFAELVRSGLQSKVNTFSGSFSFRPKRTGTKLSTHAWGIAIDLNPESNEQGTQGDMDAEVVSVFREARFTWGGDWPGRERDPMHFQFCTGY
jgi:hypothetical protein